MLGSALSTPLPGHRSSVASCSVARAPARVLLSRRCLIVSANAQQQQAQATAAPEKLSVWLGSRECEATVRLDVIPEGKGQAVVVTEVAPGSTAAQAGVVRGQKLVGISDPVRDSEVWDMGTRPSLRFVRDTLRMRRMGQIQMVFQDWKNVSGDPAWAPSPAGMPLQQADAPAASEEGASGAPPVAPTIPTPGLSVTGSMLSDSEEDGAGNMTVGEMMAARYAQQQRTASEVSEVRKRIARRAAYMEEVDKRNDTPLILGLAAAFLGPAAIILAYASATGYLDTLYTSSLTLR